VPGSRNRTILLALMLGISLAVRLWGLSDRLPDPSVGARFLDDTVVAENDRTTMGTAWSMWEGGAKPIQLNPHTSGWPALSFYLALLLQILYRGFLWMTEGVGSSVAFIAHVTRNPAGMLLFGRAASVLFGLVSVYLTYRLGASLAGHSGGLVSGLLLGLNPLHIQSSQHVADPNLLALLFLEVAAIAVLQIVDFRRLGDSLLGGGAIGLAGACKFAPLAALVPLAFAHTIGSGSPRKGPEKRWGSRLAASLVACLALFILASPYLFLDWRTTLHDLTVQRQSLFSEWVGQNQFALVAYLAKIIPTVCGWPLYLAALGGLVILWRRGTRERLIVLFPVSLLLVNSLLRVAQDRYILPAIPYLFVGAVLAFDRVAKQAGHWARRPIRPEVMQGALLLICLIGPVYSLIGFRSAMGLPDSRRVARQWILKSIDAKRPIALDMYGPLFNAGQFERPTVSWPFYATKARLVEPAYHSQWLDGLAYYVQSSETSRRFESAPRGYDTEQAFYHGLAENAPVVWESDPARQSGPRLQIRRLPKEISTRSQRDSLWATLRPSMEAPEQLSRWCLVMAEVFYMCGDDDRSIEWSQRGLTISQPTTERQLLDTCVLASLRYGSVGSAVEATRRGLLAFPSDSHFHLYHAMLLEQAGEDAGAIQEYRESLRLKPDQDNAGRILARVRELEGPNR
jgi:hypothetical protein